MPIPARKKGEQEQDFISRCIGDLSSEYDTPQASAICYQQLAVQLTVDKEWRKSFLNSPEATCLTQYKHVGSNIK
jgi:hypothetical protein